MTKLGDELVQEFRQRFIRAEENLTEHVITVIQETKSRNFATEPMTLLEFALMNALMVSTESFSVIKDLIDFQFKFNTNLMVSVDESNKILQGTSAELMRLTTPILGTHSEEEEAEE